MKVLVSAFKPFNKNENNHSMEVLKYINNVDKIVLDVVYDKCYEFLCDQYDLSSYDLIIALGEARSRKELTLETYAYNIASCSLADNSNVIKKDCKIIENGVDQIQTKVNLKGIESLVTLSTNPGKFVCNNLYYHLLTHYLDKAIFIHIPDGNEYENLAKVINNIINHISNNK